MAKPVKKEIVVRRLEPASADAYEQTDAPIDVANASADSDGRTPVARCSTRVAASACAVRRGARRAPVPE